MELIYAEVGYLESLEEFGELKSLRGENTPSVERRTWGPPVGGRHLTPAPLDLTPPPPSPR